MNIKNLKKILESEREEEMGIWDFCTGPVGYRNGHGNATDRLLPLLQKAVEMAEFVDLNTSLCPEHRRNQDIPFCSYNDCDIKIKAREFLSEFTKMTEIKKESV